MIINTNLPSNDYLFSYLLSFGTNVELLEPYDLREEFKKVPTLLDIGTQNFIMIDGKGII